MRIRAETCRRFKGGNGALVSLLRRIDFSEPVVADRKNRFVFGFGSGEVAGARMRLRRFIMLL